MTFIQHPSNCPHCNETLRWYELIPLRSFLWQRGTCKNCQARISPMYPVIELITGILFVYSYFQIGFQAELITAFLFISLLVIITVRSEERRVGKEYRSRWWR